MHRTMKIQRTLTMMLACAAILLSGSDALAQRQWRESSVSVNVPSLNDPRLSDGVEIYGINGAIVVRTPHKVQVKVFNILGQMVSQATLNVGTSELKINARGIYIVKIGNITQKVAL